MALPLGIPWIVLLYALSSTSTDVFAHEALRPSAADATACSPEDSSATCPQIVEEEESEVSSLLQWQRGLPRLAAGSAAGRGQVAEPQDPPQVSEYVQEQARSAKAEDGAVADALSFGLFGFALAAMLVFYFVNASDERLQGQTWNMLSYTVSVFCAVMLFKVGKDTTIVVFKEPADPVDEMFDLPPPLAGNSAGHFGRVLFCVALLNMLLILTRRERRIMRAIGGVGAHVVGFACIEASAVLQQHEPLRTSFLRCFSVGLVSACVMLCYAAFAGKLRRAVKPCMETHWKDWDNICREAQEQSFALTMSFLVSQAVKYFVVGRLALLQGYPKDKTIEAIVSLLGAVASMGVFALFQTYMRHKPSEQTSSRQRQWKVLVSVTAMSTAWCALDCIKWVFLLMIAGKAATAMSVPLLTGLFTMTVGFAIILSLDFVIGRHVTDAAADYMSIAPFVHAVGLAIGLSWAACFEEAALNVGAVIGGTNVGEQRLICVVVLSCICALVLPAWALYIHPRAVEPDAEEAAEDEKELNSGATLASWCGW